AQHSLSRSLSGSRLALITWLLAGAAALAIAASLAFQVLHVWHFSFATTAISANAIAQSFGFAFAGSLVGLGISFHGRRNICNLAIAGSVFSSGISCMVMASMSGLAEPFALGYHLSGVLASMLAGSLPAALAFARARLRRRVDPVSALLLGLSIIIPTMGALASILPLTAWITVIPAPGTFVLRPLGVVFVSELFIILALGLAGAGIDLQSQARVRVENRRLRQLTDSTFEALLIHRNGVILDANAAFCAMLDHPLGALKGAAVERIVPAVAAAPRLTAGSPTRQDAAQEIEIQIADGTRLPVEMLSRTIAYPGGDAEVTALRDLSERRVAEERIRFLALHDVLTGLANRFLLQQVLSRELESSKRDGHGLAIFCLDIDHFKQVNDTLGHQAGDDLLKQFALRIKANIRECDLLARIGGDEFALLQTAIRQPEAAAELAARLGTALSEPYDVVGGHVSIGVSIGISLAPQDGWHPEVLIRNTDIALDRAKGEGRSRFCFFKPGMDTIVRRRREMEQALADAIDAQQFRVFYQPILDASTLAVVGFEALLRWPSAARGPIPPDEFIPLAEETGLITRLGAWVLEAACRNAALWPDPLWVAVNVSPRQFAGGSLPQTVATILGRTGFPPGRLELEITEGVLIRDTEQAFEALRQLKTLGVKVALDDFGTGYSSLSSLHRFPFDKVKIDRSFVRRLMDDSGARAIVGAILAMSHQLDLKSTAEGVEVEAEYSLLREQGCSLMQGYLFGRPMPADAVPEYLRAHASQTAQLA
ncbi:MAG: putative bifunctional diguanylate cyclase/phosphodiesterase, partial [Acetobacteraceae bacterium]